MSRIRWISSSSKIEARRDDRHGRGGAGAVGIHDPLFRRLARSRNAMAPRAEPHAAHRPSCPSSVTFTIASMPGPGAPLAVRSHAAHDVAERLVLRLQQLEVLGLQAPTRESPARSPPGTRRPAPCRPPVAVRLQEVLLRRPAGQQRHQPPLSTSVTSFARHALVVHDVAAGDRLALELRQRRRVADGERVGQHAQADAGEERRRPAPVAMRGFSASGGRRASISGTSVWR